MQSGFYKTKSFWAGMALILTGIGMVIAGDVPQGIQTIGAGIVTIFIRDAITKVGNSNG